MINIRNIIIALLFSSTIFLISCGAVGDGSESVTGNLLLVILGITLNIKAILIMLRSGATKMQK